MIRRINPAEHQIQAAIVEWAYLQKNYDGKGSALGDYLIKIPNEGKRSIITANRMKKEGMKSGVFDLFLAVIKKKSNHYYGGLWIEVKFIKGVLSTSQCLFSLRMARMGYPVRIVNTVDEGIQAIKDYLGMK